LFDLTEQQKKYLIIGPSWVGDMVMAQSLFMQIKQREPDATIDVLAPAWTAALIDRMPQVAKLIDANFKHGKLSIIDRFLVGRKLRAQHYSHAIVLPNSLKSALVPALAKIKTRTGFVGEMRWGLLNDIRKLDKSILPMTVQRFLALGLNKNADPVSLDEIPVPKLKVDQSRIVALQKKMELSDNKPVLVLCPGAEFGASKRWPTDHYADLATFYLAQGWQVWLMGSENDTDSCDEIYQLTDAQCKMLAGRTTMPEAIDLMSVASLVVSNDSGLMHIASALQIPLIAVYGSTDPTHTPPLSANHAIAQHKLDCSPCFKRECPLQHHKCMRDLPVHQVVELARQIQ